MDNLRQLIVDHRKQQKLTVRAAAKRIGMDHTSLWKFERGQNLMETQLTKLLSWLFSK